jgi:hypothetical protein
MDEKTRRAIWKAEVRERLDQRLLEIERRRESKSFEERITIKDIDWLAGQNIKING